MYLEIKEILRNGLGFRQYNQRKVNGKQFGYINYFYYNQRGHYI